MAVGDPDTRNMIRQEFGDLPGLHLTSSSSYNLEFNRCDADKGKALRWLCDYLEIPMNQVLAMGDNENDHTMLQTAGITIAPENASDETKLLVSQVVAACREGGTADFTENGFWMSEDVRLFARQEFPGKIEYVDKK